MTLEQYQEIKDFINSYTDRCVMVEILERDGYRFSKKDPARGSYQCQALHRGDSDNAMSINLVNGVYKYYDFTEQVNNYAGGNTWSFLKERNNDNAHQAIAEFEEVTGIDIKKAIGTEQTTDSKNNKLLNYIDDCYFNLNLPENKEIIEYLKDRGETDQTIKASKLGYDSETERIIFPYWEGYKNAVSYIGRLNPKAKRKTDKDGKPRKKYKKAYSKKYPNSTDRYYYANAFIEHPNLNYMYVCEGILDCRSLNHNGVPCVSYGGGNISARAFDRLTERLKATGKTPVLVFDNDESGKKFYVESINKLIERGIFDIDFTIVPKFNDIKESEYIDYFSGSDEKDENDNFKDGRPNKDINDYCKNNGNVDRILKTRNTILIYIAFYYRNEFNKFYDYFIKLYKYIPESKVATALDVIKEAGIFGKEQFNLINKIAQKRPSTATTVKEILQKYDGRIIKHKTRGLMFFDKTWKEVDNEDLYAVISETLGRFDDGRYYDSIIKTIKAKTPTVSVDMNASKTVVFDNGTLYLDRTDKDGNFIFKENEFNPKDYRSSYLNVDYDPGATCPTWDKTIDTLVATPDNPEDAKRKKAMLEEFLGYLLEPDNSTQRKCLFIRGEGFNGKNLFTNTIQNLFDVDSVTNISLSELEKPFKKSELRNSLLNVSGEDKASLYKVAEEFKGLISGDPQQGNVKFKKDVKFIPHTKLMVTSNEFVRSADRSKGVSSRLLLIEFLTCFVNKPLDECDKFERPKDINLTEKLKRERPGIVNRMLEGYKRLSKNGDFTYSDEHKHLLNEFIVDSNPVIEFLREEKNEIFDKLKEDGEIRSKEERNGVMVNSPFIDRLWLKYGGNGFENYCYLNSIDNPGKKSRFVKSIYDNLADAFPNEIEKGRDKKSNFARFKPNVIEQLELEEQSEKDGNNLKMNSFTQKDIDEIEQQGFTKIG